MPELACPSMPEDLGMRAADIDRTPFFIATRSTSAHLPFPDEHALDDRSVETLFGARRGDSLRLDEGLLFSTSRNPHAPLPQDLSNSTLDERVCEDDCVIVGYR